MKKKNILLITLLACSLHGEEEFNFDAADTETISAYELKSEPIINQAIIQESKILNDDIKSEPEVFKDKKESQNIEELPVSADELISEPESPTIIIEEENSAFGDSADKSAPTVIKEEKPKEPLKKYSNVKYVESYKWFSILDTTESFFNSELFRLQWTMDSFLKKLSARSESPDMIYMSALYYDYVQKDPSVAENFYLKFRDLSAQNRMLRVYLADYLIRTGRYKNMQKIIIRDNDIHAFIGCKGSNYHYYRGVFEYLNTKNKKTAFIKKAANCGISKAKEFLK